MEPIRYKDFQPINALSIGAILLMFGATIWNITNNRMGWAIADLCIAIFNIGALYFSLSTHRDLRVETEILEKKK